MLDPDHDYSPKNNEQFVNKKSAKVTTLPFVKERELCFDKIQAENKLAWEAIPKGPISVHEKKGEELVLIEGSFTTHTSTPFDVLLQLASVYTEKAEKQAFLDKYLVARVTYPQGRMGPQAKIADSSGFEVEDLEEEEQKVDEELWDLARPLEGHAQVEFLTFDDPDGKMVFWHSSAHVLGECLECGYGCHLTVGPPVENGFYYDAYMGDASVSVDMKADLTKKAQKVNKLGQRFERIVLTKAQALDLFKANPFKVSLIQNKIQDGAMTSAYRCGPLIDLCMGPHIPNTKKIKAMEVTKVSAAYWLGNAANPSLQRVYGVSFPSEDQLKKHKLWLEEAKVNDHRIRGRDQQLYFFDDISPGSCFWEPHGTRIYNALLTYIRGQYRLRGYGEVITPNMYNVKLWQTSGHWAHYKQNMFVFSDGEGKDIKELEDLQAKARAQGKTEEEVASLKIDHEHNHGMYALKPMNCPGHCVMFKKRKRTLADLPLRMADFGVLHRNELRGALSGLTRVRRFQQDDAHIFCAQEQIHEEVLGALNFMKAVYGEFGMKFALRLSTRPKKAIGLDTPEGVKLWDDAEESLRLVLNEFVGQGNWKLKPGDGAFYGPKIDIQVFDFMNRDHQCATIQLDFQLPINFDLNYVTYGTGENPVDVIKRPVMIHRAMLGSLERMIAILTEHYRGKWPFWLAPRHAVVVPMQVFKDEIDVRMKVLLEYSNFCALVYPQ